MEVVGVGAELLHAARLSDVVVPLVVLIQVVPELGIHVLGGDLDLAPSGEVAPTRFVHVVDGDVGRGAVELPPALLLLIVRLVEDVQGVLHHVTRRREDILVLSVLRREVLLQSTDRNSLDHLRRRGEEDREREESVRPLRSTRSDENEGRRE
ncbi:hypothetical protein PENTCL1PPCAC_21285 [Pristionchus entomophagus]|uniref:Secreted protein n=1 Tax=Pristionchus entomophagus TaxID=358040 RepID=A0AAV5TX41_9BILA|nr:hypothetical protein PENTCL1PPCAC_21285 [Pristionchus entomophagus]